MRAETRQESANVMSMSLEYGANCSSLCLSYLASADPLAANPLRVLELIQLLVQHFGGPFTCIRGKRKKSLPLSG